MPPFEYNTSITQLTHLILLPTQIQSNIIKNRGIAAYSLLICVSESVAYLVVFLLVCPDIEDMQILPQPNIQQKNILLFIDLCFYGIKTLKIKKYLRQLIVLFCSTIIFILLLTNSHFQSCLLLDILGCNYIQHQWEISLQILSTNSINIKIMLKIVALAFLLISLQSKDALATGASAIIKEVAKNIPQGVGTMGNILSGIGTIGGAVTIANNVYSLLSAPGAEVNIFNRMGDYSLDRPTYYLSNGECSSVCPVIPSITRASCKFTNAFPYHNVNGVLTYRIKKDNKNTLMLDKLVIYFYNPLIGNNQFCVFFTQNISTDQQIFDQINDKKRPQCVLAQVKKSKPGVVEAKNKIAKIYATMNSASASQIQITVEKNLDKPEEL